MLWGTRAGSTGNDSGQGIATDAGSNVYVTGQYTNTFTLYNSSTTAFSNTLSNVAGSLGDVFIAKYNGFTGDVSWAARAGSTGADIGYSIVTDTGSNVYVTGQYTNTFTLYNSSTTAFSNTLSNVAGTVGDVFVAKYNGFTGDVSWAARATSNGADVGYSLTTDTGSNVYVTGQYTNTFTLYNSSETAFSNTLANVAGTVGDVFVAKYNGFTGAVSWAARATSNGSDIGYGIVTDLGTNVYVSGQYSNTLTIYNSNTTSFGNTLSNVGANGSFLGKYDTNSGSVISANSTRSNVSASSISVLSVAYDATSSNVYVSGYYNGVFIAYDQKQNPVFTPDPVPVQSSFLAKYTPNGQILWFAKQAAVTTAAAQSVTVDASGNVYVTGQYTGTMNVFSSSGTQFSNTLANSGSSDVFIIKYSSTGNVTWAARAGSLGADVGNSIITDPGSNVYVTGQYGGLLTIYNSSGTAFSNTLAQIVGFDAFILKYDGFTGNVSWVARAGSAGSDAGVGITSDTGSNVYTTGYYNGTMTFYNSSTTAFSNTLAQIGGADVFIAKYDRNTGNVLWVTRAGSAGTDVGQGIATDAGSNVYVTGYYTGTMALYNSSTTQFSNTLASFGGGFQDIFIAKYNSFTGDVIWATRIGSSSSNDIGYGVATDSYSNVYVAGYYAPSTVAFYNASGTPVFNNQPSTSGSNDIFVTKYNGTTGDFIWSAIAGANGTDQGYGIAVDPLGSQIYVCGVHGTTQPNFFDSRGEPYLASTTGSTVAGGVVSRIPINL